jgi:hypothetical protein
MDMQVAFRTYFHIASNARFARASAAESFRPTWPGSTTNAGPAQLLRRDILTDK